MFKTSDLNKQEDFFGSFDFNFSSRKGRALNDTKSWWNLFYRYVTREIDESLFRRLFSDSMGCPNASISVLVSMMILKEGFGWSDKRLFEECNFNILVMRSLGLSGLNDTIPSESTYYLFKQRIYARSLEEGEDLIAKVFKSLTGVQAKVFGVSGDQIRMDSKLIGSNIANCCRLRLILACVILFWKSLPKAKRQSLSKEDQRYLNELIDKQPQQLVYRLSNEEKAQLLERLGTLIQRLLSHYSSEESKHYPIIQRILNEQYVIDSDQKVVLKEGKAIEASSLQSPHDPDATYRVKRDESVQGYAVNMTETCHSEGLNLITDVQVEPATVSDKQFVQSAIENTESIVGPVNEVSMDGAYNDVSNADYAKEKGKNFIFTGIQGAKGRYSFLILADGRVAIIDAKSGEVTIAINYKEGKFKFTTTEGKVRYFTQKDIDSYLRRLKIERMPEEIKNRRNNVEATIFQLVYFTRNNKTRYRGKEKHQFWATCRAMWNNLVRIGNHMGEMCPQTG